MTFQSNPKNPNSGTHESDAKNKTVKMVTRKHDLSSVDGEEMSIANSFMMPSRIDGDKMIDGFTDRLNS